MNYHSNYYLDKEWKLTKLGLLMFPLLPTLGILTLVFAAISSVGWVSFLNPTTIY